ncbi:hypothetical protein ASC95_01275 [Pelomonas sp. Root1217]|uniref:hypothetical protein n=1 Tax=Pelomonas sp. Root1217 TaxID=1736430 RepID=UPI00070B2D8F|nr:hypothetical protein [Pelomonas sp. Root1217]KQV60138.1 hypothetical protein ASC95_01275 [Pelomonas sp. Root1217]
MDYGDEKVIIDLKDGDSGEILFTDKDGKQATYYPSHSIWLDVQTLEVLTVLNEPAEGAEPSIGRRLRGVAVLEDRSISVVGDPRSKSRRLTISFDPGDWKSKPAPEGEAALSSLDTQLGGAMLSFSRADWEIGNDDEWWIACYLPPAFIDSLIADVRSGQLYAVKLSLSLRGLYTSSHHWEPVSARGDLFIRPNREDNSLSFPDMARGYVRAIHFSSSPRDLRRPEPADVVEPSSEEEFRVEEPDPMATAITALAMRVDQLRSTIKWVGGFIVLALLFVAGSGR